MRSLHSERISSFHPNHVIRLQGAKGVYTCATNRVISNGSTLYPLDVHFATEMGVSAQILPARDRSMRFLHITFHSGVNRLEKRTRRNAFDGFHTTCERLNEYYQIGPAPASL